MNASIFPRKCQFECDFCGSLNTLTVASVSLPDCQEVRCSVCGKLAMTIGEFRSSEAGFREEVEHYLLLGREQNADKRYIKGSYAGAIGIPQVMPSRNARPGAGNSSGVGDPSKPTRT